MMLDPINERPRLAATTEPHPLASVWECERFAGFIEARLAEDKRIAEALLFACRDPSRLPGFELCGGPAAEAFWERFTPERMARAAEFGQTILLRHTVHFGLPGGTRNATTFWCRCGDPYPCYNLCRLVVQWRNHPDYKSAISVPDSEPSAP